MFNLLIVDDEYYAVESIVQGIPWPELNIAGVLQAYSARAARELFLASDIHIMIADIEMPDETGLELLEWVNEHYPRVKTIFLTAHSNFAYAQKALQLGSFDYLVKPVDKKRLAAIVEQAAAAVRKERGLNDAFHNYEHYLALWNATRPLLTESFWQQAIDQHISMREENVQELFKLYDIPLPAEQPVRLLLFHIDFWDREFSLRDMKVLQYAIKNAALEMLDGGNGIQAFYDRQDHLFVLLPAGGAHADEHELSGRCVRFMDACRAYFYCQLACYGSDAVEYAQLAATSRKLQEMERSDVTRLQLIRWLRDAALPLADGGDNGLARLPKLHGFLETGNGKAAKETWEEMFAHLERSGSVTNATLQTIYFGIVFMLFDLAQKQGVEAGTLYDLGKLDQSEATRTLPNCKRWSQDVIETLLRLHNQGKERNALIDKIHAFIDQRLCAEFSREDIAGHVHLNPVYVSRLYKKETGMSLTDYILEKRMERAQRYLTETSYKVTAIMEMVGYQSISHFTQMFKKVYRMTPQEYRKHNRSP
ncbi:MAG: response regulator [Paenibacillaceae bacterium]|nr:response regulator [Paenibacillaceae bacterium]